MSNNYPIYAEVQYAIGCLPIHLEFHHIKDHQDTRFNKVLTILEKLNFDCYAWALSLVLYTHIETLQDNLPVKLSGIPSSMDSAANHY